MDLDPRSIGLALVTTSSDYLRLLNVHKDIVAIAENVIERYGRSESRQLESVLWIIIIQNHQVSRYLTIAKSLITK